MDILEKINNIIGEDKVEYKPLQNKKKPFKYKNKWYNRDELKKMGLDKEASKAIMNEASGAGTSYELMWNEIWNRPFISFMDPDNNEVVWSNSDAYPTGAILSDADILKLQSQGYQILYRRKVTEPKMSASFGN